MQYINSSKFQNLINLKAINKILKYFSNETMLFTVNLDEYYLVFLLKRDLIQKRKKKKQILGKHNLLQRKMVHG